MGGASGFGQTVACGTGHDDVDGTLQADPVPRRDKEWFGASPRAQGCSYYFAPIYERLPRAALLWQRIEATQQEAFGYPDCWQPREYTQVAGDP
jgi:hypothetical protein